MCRILRLEVFGVRGLELESSEFEVWVFRSLSVWKFGEFGSLNDLVFIILQVCVLELRHSTLDRDGSADFLFLISASYFFVFLPILVLPF